MSTTLQIAGYYLIIEGLASILYSVDKRSISQLGRLGRIGIGIYLLKYNSQQK